MLEPAAAAARPGDLVSQCRRDRMPRLQLGVSEVQAVLLDAWETVAELLPEVVVPAGLSWAAPPSAELRTTCEARRQRRPAGP